MLRSSVTILTVLCLLLAALGMLTLSGCSGGEPVEEVVVTTTEAPTTTTTAVDGSIVASEVIVRDGPGFEYDSIGGISYDEDVTIVGHEGDWYRVAFGDGYGYVSAAFVDVEDQPNASEMAAAFTTISRAPTTSRTKPQPPTTTTTAKAGAGTTTGTATAATTATSAEAPADRIPDTATDDSLND